MESTHRKKYLFIDNEIIQRASNLRRVVNPAQQHHEPILRLDAPWDARSDLFNYVNVLYDAQAKLFRMWYCVTDKRGQKWDGAAKWAHATSTDGIHWEKPILGLHEVHGTKQNNYVFPESEAFYFTLIDDPSDIPERRFKMVCMAQQLYHGGKILDRVAYHVPLSIGYSHDGIDWHFPTHVNPVIRGVSDGGFAMFYDPDRRKYVLLTRRVPNLPRDVSQYESYDLVNWEDCGRVIVPGDKYDPPDMFNFQAMTAMRYEDMYLGLLNTHYSLPFAEDYESQNKPPADYPNQRLGRVDIQLAYSRDGRAWHRPKDRTTLWPVGRCGDFNVRMLFPQTNPPVVKDGDTYMYALGVTWPHCHWAGQEAFARDDGDVRNQSFALMAKMPEDHWVSLDAGEQEGVLVTTVLGIPQRLLVNADAQGGYVAAEYVTPYGQVLDGFSRGECIPVTANGKAQEIRWRGGRDAFALNAQHLGGIFIRIFVKNAKLYSLLWEQPDPDGSVARKWANHRWTQTIKHRNDQWGRRSNDAAPGLPEYKHPDPLD